VAEAVAEAVEVSWVPSVEVQEPGDAQYPALQGPSHWSVVKDPPALLKRPDAQRPLQKAVSPRAMNWPHWHVSWVPHPGSALIPVTVQGFPFAHVVQGEGASTLAGQ